MKWKNTPNVEQKKTRRYQEVQEEKAVSDEDFKRKAKKLHPDGKDPFLKSRYTKRFQELNNSRGKK